MPAAGYLILFAGWIVWLLPFLLRRPARAGRQTDKRARWGMALQGVAYAVLWQGPFWRRTPSAGAFTAAIVLFAVAALLSWRSVPALGPQWRVDAGLAADHRLVRTGPYRWLRHPIYSSMLWLLLGTGILLTPSRLFATAVVLFFAGTEIRVRIEDRLLAGRFGSDWRAYRAAVPAYIPFLR
jgi:protein-S-isoprenylcysteine O-methyltransferase Ste14